MLDYRSYWKINPVSYLITSNVSQSLNPHTYTLMHPWLWAHTLISTHLGAWLTRGSAWYRGKLYVLNSSLVVIPGQVSSVGVPVEEIFRLGDICTTKSLHKEMLVQILLLLSHQGCGISDEAHPPRSIQGREVCLWSFHKRYSPHPWTKRQKQQNKCQPTQISARYSTCNIYVGCDISIHYASNICHP